MTKDSLVSFRRTLHKNAEPGFCEIGTASRIEEKLEKLPLTILKGERVQDTSHVGAYPDVSVRHQWFLRAVDSGVSEERAQFFLNHGTGIVAVLAGDRPGPVWGLRTDIDALPIRETEDASHFPTAEGFNSTNGAMHACGHDCHAAIGVGLLEELSDHHFPGTLKVIFQPAEEGVRGAQTILNTDVADDITKMLAIHVRGEKPVGNITASGTGGMATNKFLIHFAGRSAHASADPQDGRNALLAAASMAMSLMSLPRFSTADTRLNVGTLHAGDNVNIVPAHAEMACEARAANDAVLNELTRRVKLLVSGTAESYEVTPDFQITGTACTMHPDPQLVDAIIDAAKECEQVQFIDRLGDMKGSDDAALFIRNTQQHGGQGAYIHVGADSPAPHHNDHFDAKEDSIGIGIDVLANLIRA